MKILLLCYEFPPLGGGGSKVVHGLARELSRLGHEVELITMAFAGAPRRERVEGVLVHRVWAARRRIDRSNSFELGIYFCSAFITLLRLCRRRTFDLWHAHFIFPDGALAWLASRLTGTPYLITAHGSDVPGYNPDRFILLHRLLAPVWRLAVAHAARVITPSPTLAALVVRNFGEAATVTIPNGFDPGRFTPDVGRRRGILVVSRLFKRKGVQYLIRALADLGAQSDLIIVGDGPYRGKLEQMAGESGASVRFLGWLENSSDELKRLYETCGIFVLFSEAENFPVVLLEAMAAGMAIITTSGTGCADVVGDAALLVPPHDLAELSQALATLLEQDEVRRSLGARARERVTSQFAWPLIAGRHVELYCECLAQAGADVSEEGRSSS